MYTAKNGQSLMDKIKATHWTTTSYDNSMPKVLLHNLHAGDLDKQAQESLPFLMEHDNLKYEKTQMAIENLLNGLDDNQFKELVRKYPGGADAFRERLKHWDGYWGVWGGSRHIEPKPIIDRFNRLAASGF
jgi:hypothetical protein